MKFQWKFTLLQTSWFFFLKNRNFTGSQWEFHCISSSTLVTGYSGEFLWYRYLAKRLGLGIFDGKVLSLKIKIFSNLIEFNPTQSGLVVNPTYWYLTLRGESNHMRVTYCTLMIQPTHSFHSAPLKAQVSLSYLCYLRSSRSMKELSDTSVWKISRCIKIDYRTRFSLWAAMRRWNEREAVLLSYEKRR